MTVVVGGPVKPHVEKFAVDVERLFGVSCTTYEGHQPHRTLGLDIWGTRAQRDAVMAYYKQNYIAYGGDYIIDNQRIWNPEISPEHRLMPNRGNDTANHIDHTHTSFLISGFGIDTSISEGEITMDIANEIIRRNDATIRDAQKQIQMSQDDHAKDILEAIRGIGHATEGVDNSVVDQIVDKTVSKIMKEQAQRLTHDPDFTG